jgi:phosphopantetheinyl transferase
MDHGAINLVGTDLSISLSSTGSRLVAAGIRGHRIGIDIEQGQLEDRREIAVRIGNQDVTLAQWCEYESVVKAAGVGISLSIDEIQFTNIAGRKTACLNGIPDQYEVIPATQHDDVVLAVALSC